MKEHILIGIEQKKMTARKSKMKEKEEKLSEKIKRKER